MNSAVTGHELIGLFLAAGDDPYSLVTTAARSVMRWLGTGRLREEKRLPAFVDQFGWCTWDAFYSEVSHDKVRLGLASLAAGGVRSALSAHSPKMARPSMCPSWA